jgi:hypothetical protein
MVKWGSLTWPTQWSDRTSTYGLHQVRSPCVPGLGSSFHHADLLRIVLTVYTNKNVQILTSSYSSTSLLDKFTCFKPVIVVIIHSKPFVFWVLSIFMQSNIFYQGAQFLLWSSSISTSLLWRAILCVHFRGDQLIFLLRLCENPWNTQWQHETILIHVTAHVHIHILNASYRQQSRVGRYADLDKLFHGMFWWVQVGKGSQF